MYERVDLDNRGDAALDLLLQVARRVAEWPR